MAVSHALNLSKRQIAPMLTMHAHDAHAQHDDQCREEQRCKEMGRFPHA